MGANADPDTTLELVRDYAVPPERLFAALLDEEVLRHIWSAPGYTIVEMSVDARVGGGWHLAMRDEASGVVNRCAARYVEVQSPRRIVWLTKWIDGPLAAAPEARVTLSLSPLADGTRLALRHEFFPNRLTRDHHRSGWGSALERLSVMFSGTAANAE